MNNIVTLEIVCAKCGKVFTVTREKKKLHGKNKPSHCSRKCANSRTHSSETIEKIKKGVISHFSNTIANYAQKESNKTLKIKKIKEIKYCISCGEICKKKYCSLECSYQHRTKQHTIDIVEKLINGENINMINMGSTKKALISIKGHRCEKCKETTWLGEPIPLVLDHINGRSSDNVLSNLRLVCGNCDMTLPTYKSKNKNSDRNNRKKYQ